MRTIMLVTVLLKSALSMPVLGADGGDEAFDWKTITCPVVGALFRSGAIVPDDAGFVTKRAVFGAFLRSSISEEVATATTDGNFDHLPEPKSINIFDMDVPVPVEKPTSGAKEHDKSTGIRDGPTPNATLYEIFASFADASGGFNKSNLQAAIEHFRLFPNDVNPFIEDDLLMGSLSSIN